MTAVLTGLEIFFPGPLFAGQKMNVFNPYMEPTAFFQEHVYQPGMV